MPLRLTFPNEVKRFLLASTSREDASRRVDAIMDDNGGQYPSWWFKEIVATAFLALLDTNFS